MNQFEFKEEVRKLISKLDKNINVFVFTINTNTGNGMSFGIGCQACGAAHIAELDARGEFKHSSNDEKVH